MCVWAGPPVSYAFHLDSTVLDGALVDAWLYFPGLKVGQMYIYSSFFTIYFFDYLSFLTIRYVEAMQLFLKYAFDCFLLPFLLAQLWFIE